MEQAGNDTSSKPQEIRFLSDQPLDADREQEMRFGHPSLVDNLRNIVQISSFNQSFSSQQFYMVWG